MLEDLRTYKIKTGSSAAAIALFHRGFHLVVFIRLQQYAMQFGPFGRVLAKIGWYMSAVLTGCEISYHAKIGHGFYIPHPVGIVIGDAVISENVTLLQGVTIGKSSQGLVEDCPRIGANVFIGAGAKIIGGIEIGEGCIIGANAVVLKDVPPHHLAAGVPAKSMPIRD